MLLWLHCFCERNFGQRHIVVVEISNGEIPWSSSPTLLTLYLVNEHIMNCYLPDL